MVEQPGSPPASRPAAYPRKGDQLAVGPRREEPGHGPILSITGPCRRADGLAKLSKLPGLSRDLREAGGSDQAKVPVRCRRDAILGLPWRRHARASASTSSRTLSPRAGGLLAWIRAMIC